jgi:2-iminobutanoate/2-iminopropanoate deaminase
MEDFAKVNKIYGEYFQQHHPSRILVAVEELPRNAKLGIEAIVAYPADRLL